MSKKAVIFDMDGVLVDSNPVHKIAIRQFCEKYNKKLSENELKQHIWGRTNREWIGYLFGREASETALKAYAIEKEALFRQLYASTIREVDGLTHFLQHLHHEGVDLAIGTSAPPENVQFVFEHTGIGSYFRTILDETFVTHGKPNPEIYLKVAAALGYAPADCVVFEDSLSGIEAAQRAGCKVVGVLTTHTAEELSHTDWVITDFQGVSMAALLRLW